MKTLYDTDYYAWIEQQASLIRNNLPEELDYNNILEEIDALGRSEKRTLVSFLRNALVHMLKAKYQPMWHTKSWDDSIEFSICEAKEMLEQCPSLKSKLDESFERAYRKARFEATKQTGLLIETFPKECPWTINEVLGEEFFKEQE